jgi:hypothetical protein
MTPIVKCCLIEGPLLNTGRPILSCAMFKSPQYSHTDTVIVTGGMDDNFQYLDSTEFLNLESSNSWTLGKGHKADHFNIEL